MSELDSELRYVCPHYNLEVRICESCLYLMKRLFKAGFELALEHAEVEEDYYGARHYVGAGAARKELEEQMRLLDIEATRP